MSIIANAACTGFTKKNNSVLFTPDLTADYPAPSSIKHRYRTSTMSDADGAQIASFNDEVSGNHFVQATAGLRPVMSRPQLGSLGALLFSSKRMTTTNAMPEYAAMTVLMAVKGNSTAGGYILQMNSDTKSIVQGFSAGNYTFYTGTHTPMNPSSISTTAYKARITTNASSAVSGYWILGSAAGGAAPYPGYILDIMIWDIVLDLTQRTAALSKMNTHYSLTA